MGNNFSSKYELFRNVKADDKKGMNKNYGIFLVLRRKTGLSGFLQLQFCIHFFCFCWQAFSQKHSLAVGKPKQVGEHPIPGAESVLLADVAVDQQPDFF